jgi:hypothetical protein
MGYDLSHSRLPTFVASPFIDIEFAQLAAI